MKNKFQKNIIMGEKEIVIEAMFQGEDIIITCSGGDRPHIGAVAFAISRPSLTDSRVGSASTSLITMTGHKDDEIAVPLAKIVSSESHRNVVVIAGVHIDNIKSSDITEIVKQVKIIGHEISNVLSKNEFNQKGGDCYGRKTSKPFE